MSRISLDPSISRFLLSPRLRSLHRSAPFPFTVSCCSPDPRVAQAQRQPPAPKRRSGAMSWWWKRAVGQRFNSGGVSSFADVAAREPHLALPHLSVPDIRWLDWAELERAGFRGVVFDKDNTLTAPYSLSLWPPLSHSMELCRAAFPGKIAVFSNSTGLQQYDPDGSEAKALEESIGGIHVIRHENKKPTETAEDIEKYFGCSASLLVMVGDRHFTDIVYGNRHGFLTILTEPLSQSEDPFIVKQVRKIECYLVDRWYEKGLKPSKHSLLSETTECVKDPSL